MGFDLMTVLTYVGIVLMTFGAMCVNYGSFSVTCIRWLRPFKVQPGKPVEQPPMDTSEVVSCYIPVWHAIKVNTAMAGSVIFNVMVVTGTVFMALNLINKFLLPINGLVMFVCSIMMFVGLALFWFGFGFITANAAYTFGFGAITVVLCFILPHFTCWYLKNNIPGNMADVIDIPVLSRDFTNERIKMPFPHIRLLDPSDAVALVLPSLDKGDLPVLCSVGGVTKQIGAIRRSAKVISALMHVTDIEYISSPGNSAKICTTQDAINIFTDKV